VGILFKGGVIILETRLLPSRDDSDNRTRTEGIIRPLSTMYSSFVSFFYKISKSLLAPSIRPGFNDSLLAVLPTVAMLIKALFSALHHYFDRHIGMGGQV
jgi:hypothetical protein